MIGSKKAGPTNYRLVWARDPALRQLELPMLEDGASEEATIQHEAAVTAATDARIEELRVARETQDWSALLLPNEKPTFFVMRWVPALVRRVWNDQLRVFGGDMGHEEGLALLFLLALVDIENFGGRKFKVEDSELFNDSMAPASFLDELRRVLGPRDSDHLIGTLAGQVFDQEAKTGPL